MAFLPAIASDHRLSSITYKLELLKNCRAYNLLAMCSKTQTYWQWARPKFHSLLSAHHLIGVYFLTTESDKHICLLTRLYDNQLVPWVIHVWPWQCIFGLTNIVPAISFEHMPSTSSHHHGWLLTIVEQVDIDNCAGTQWHMSNLMCTCMCCVLQ